MKILMSRHTYKHHVTHPQDYLCDNIFHGLRSLGHEVTDDRRCWYMYKSEFLPWGGQYRLDLGHHPNNPLYGGGFSYAATLDEDMSIVRDHNTIKKRIQEHYYDKIIIGRPEFKPNYMDLIYGYYNRKDIIELDGRDEGEIDLELSERAVYFRRELIDNPTKFMRPISFSIAKSKCLTQFPEKKQLWGTVVPYKPETYIFNIESEYYADYAKSLFARTCKKAGWDCMRHYEILANRCVPYFDNLEKAPGNTMKTLPKDLLIYVKQLIDQHGAEYFIPGNPGWPQYRLIEQKIHDHFIKNCTTEAAAKYMLDCN